MYWFYIHLMNRIVSHLNTYISQHYIHNLNYFWHFEWLKIDGTYLCILWIPPYPFIECSEERGIKKTNAKINDGILLMNISIKRLHIFFSHKWFLPSGTNAEIHKLNKWIDLPHTDRPWYFLQADSLSHLLLQLPNVNNVTPAFGGMQVKNYKPSAIFWFMTK